MGSNPINLAVRFLLEMVALVVFGYWGWIIGEGLFGYVLAIGLPVIVAVVWGRFAVPDDPSRSGKAPVVVPGIVRLFLELAFFAAASVGLMKMGSETFAWVFGGVVLLHFLASYDRVAWLMKQK